MLGRWVHWWELNRGSKGSAGDLVEPRAVMGSNTWNPRGGAAEMACPLPFGLVLPGKDRQ